LSAEQRQTIKNAFSRAGRPLNEAEWTLHRLPDVLRQAMAWDDDARQVRSRRSLKVMKTHRQKVCKAQKHVECALAALSPAAPLVRQELGVDFDRSYTDPVTGQAEQAIAPFDRAMRDLRIVCERLDDRNLWTYLFRFSGGKPPDTGRAVVLEQVARLFAHQRIPLTTTQNGLFASVARALLPGERTTIPHLDLRGAILRVRRPVVRANP
jgi:hypothetical protein